MKKFKILYIAAVASLLAACANEEDGIGNPLRQAEIKHQHQRCAYHPAHSQEP